MLGVAGDTWTNLSAFALTVRVMQMQKRRVW
jgi:hypothetical protein